MNIKEIAYFPTQLKHVETQSIKAEKRAATIKGEFSIGVEVKGEIINDDTGKSTVKIIVENEDFYMEEVKIGLFGFSEKITNEKQAIQFMEVQGIRILWSYLREDLYSISSKMLSVPIMIPTIDVMKTLENAE